MAHVLKYNKTYVCFLEFWLIYNWLQIEITFKRIFFSYSFNLLRHFLVSIYQKQYFFVSSVGTQRTRFVKFLKSKLIECLSVMNLQKISLSKDFCILAAFLKMGQNKPYRLLINKRINSSQQQMTGNCQLI